MNQRTLSKVFIWGFLFLYLLVAGISFCHAVQFFNIGNVLWMAGTLAFAFELGLALSLAAILLSDDNKKNKLPWILMIVLTFVQVVGNVYSTFKYISLSDVDYYIYLQKPLLFWIEEISQETVQVIISWIIGAILPIVALFMTDMVASNIKIVYSHKDDETDAQDDIDDNLIEAPKDDKTDIKEIQNVLNNEDISKDDTHEIDDYNKELVLNNNNDNNSKEINEDDVNKEVGNVSVESSESSLNDLEQTNKTEPEKEEEHLNDSNEDNNILQKENIKIIPEESKTLDDSSLKEINNDVEFDEQDIPDFIQNDKTIENNQLIKEKSDLNEEERVVEDKPQTYIQSSPKINRNVPNELITTSVKTI